MWLTDKRKTWGGKIVESLLVQIYIIIVNPMPKNSLLLILLLKETQTHAGKPLGGARVLSWLQRYYLIIFEL